jgi:hypothetical protein
MEESYQTPIRLYINLDDGLLYISDYVFPDETVADIGDRISELLDFKITQPNQQIIHVESFSRNSLSKYSETPG